MKGQKIPFVAAVCTFAALLAAHGGAPQLTVSPVPLQSAGIKAKILARAKEKIQVTPAAQKWECSFGGKTWTETRYDVHEIWREHELIGEWYDSGGNSLTLAKVTTPYPRLDDDHAKREDIDKRISEGKQSFADPSNEALARWASRFTAPKSGNKHPTMRRKRTQVLVDENGNIVQTISPRDESARPDPNDRRIPASAITPFSVGSYAIPDARLVDVGGASHVAAFFKTKDGRWYWADFTVSIPARQRESLMKTFLKGVTPIANTAQSAAQKPKRGLAGYKFHSDLSQSRGEQFLKRAGELLPAMQAAYRRYVPPQREIGESKVRVFATRAAYESYLKDADAAEMGATSIGIWLPNREELCILYQGTGTSDLAETLKIMRHEAFHQYLYYATGSGKHAMWFNEGHACFFENIKTDTTKRSVRIWDDPHDRRPKAVAENPEMYARRVKDILSFNRKAFYSGTLREVNANYTAAWALIYFLQKGAPSFKEFAAYRQVLPTYLKEMAEGKTWREATKAAWSPVESRDFVADFLKFWNKRNAARPYEPGAGS